MGSDVAERNVSNLSPPFLVLVLKKPPPNNIPRQAPSCCCVSSSFLCAQYRYHSIRIIPCVTWPPRQALESAPRNACLPCLALMTAGHLTDHLARAVIVACHLSTHSSMLAFQTRRRPYKVHFCLRSQSISDHASSPVIQSDRHAVFRNVTQEGQSEGEAVCSALHDKTEMHKQAKGDVV